jgi:hypothetical protein
MKGEDKFRAKGHSILEGSPYSMKDFIEDKPRNAQTHKDTSAQMHKTAAPQNYSGANTQAHKGPISPNDSSGTTEDAVERIHVQIRKDLADRLIQMVYTRKLSEKKASQRGIIEQALEEYFHNHK